VGNGEDDVDDPVRGQELDLALSKGSAGDRQKRLGNLGRARPDPGAETTGEDQNLHN
jgi:hypothetical protein